MLLHVLNTMVPSHLTLGDLDQIQGHSDCEGLFLIIKGAKLGHVTIQH